jgi:hypothetical protein
MIDLHGEESDANDPIVEIGHDVAVQRVAGKDGKTLGFEYRHPCRSGPAVHWLNTSEPLLRPCWDVVSESPLTLAPSLLCRACGHHGFIRDGKWIPC